MLAGADDVQHWLPGQHDAYGITTPNVPPPEAHNHDPGTGTANGPRL